MYFYFVRQNKIYKNFVSCLEWIDQERDLCVWGGGEATGRNIRINRMLGNNRSTLIPRRGAAVSFD